MNIDKAFEQLNAIIPPEQLLRGESMKKHTSFRIGGPVDIMVLPSEIEHIQTAVDILNKNDVPVMVMGNGSNLLVHDKGIRGAIIKISDKYCHSEVIGETIKAQSGILLSSLSRIALKANLTGLEFASGIPGTLGGGVTMNAGAYGGEIKDVVEWVSVLDEHGEIAILHKDKLSFEYRTSSIQDSQQVVLEVFMVLKKGNFEESKAIVADLTRRRQEKQPLNYPSAGSTFKRPAGYYAGKLIQDAGLRGMRIGDAQVSELHSGFIINLGKATANDVISLIDLIKQRVKEQFGVDLHPEVRIVGQE